MRVPILDLSKQHVSIRADLERAIARVIDSGRFILGPEVERLEAELAALHGCRKAVGVSSGTDALLASLMALGVQPGDEVVTSAFSFFATAGAIARLGAVPVFADLGEDFLIDPKDALARVTGRTRAILPVDLFGRRANIGKLSEAGLPVLEDAAQAIGFPGVGNGVLAATLSFFPSKNLGALGDGGMILTDDETFAEKLVRLRSHGSRPKYVHGVLGGNFRIDALQAAVISTKLPHLVGWNQARRKNASRYRAALADLPELDLPGDVAGHIWHHFVIRSSRRDELREHLKAEGVETEVYYPLPLHLQPCFETLGGRPGDRPIAERCAREALAIPVHPELSDEQAAHVIRAMRSFFLPGGAA